MDLVDNLFLAFNITSITRDSNQQVDSLGVSTSGFKVPMQQRLKYEIELKYRSSILDNVKHWQVFEDDEHLNKFL